MTHAGTMDLAAGAPQTQAAERRLMPAIALTVAVVAAIVASAWPAVERRPRGRHAAKSVADRS